MRNFEGAVIAGYAEVPYRRRPPGVTTELLLRDAYRMALISAGVTTEQVDGLAVSSFTLRPDHAIDLAWKLGIRPRWIMEDTNGGASGINMLQHAARAVQAGDAEVVVLLSGDHMGPDALAHLNDNFNSTVRDYLAPLPFGGPNTLFSIITERQMKAEGLDRRDYGLICIAQRDWAQRNPSAAYRTVLTMSEYLAAPPVVPPLGRFDCVPVVSGANAIVVMARHRACGSAVGIRALHALHNFDHQTGNGLTTGISKFADGLWSDAGIEPAQIDAAYVYDDYPAMVVAQLKDLGFMEGTTAKAFLHETLKTKRLPVNTSGGQLSAGQAGAAGGMHGLTEAIAQLKGSAGERQLPSARYAVVSGYGMMEYRYCLCANAVVLERLQ